MDEEELEALIGSRSFGTRDAAAWFSQARGGRISERRLGLRYGATLPPICQRQLLAPHPEVPPGVDLADLRKLLVWTQQMVAAISTVHRLRGLPPGVRPALTEWEARSRLCAARLSIGKGAENARQLLPDGHQLRHRYVELDDPGYHPRRRRMIRSI